MKTITQILNEMIINEKEINKLQDKSLGELRGEIRKTQENCQKWIEALNHYQGELEITLKQTIKKVKKITLLLSIATIINAISIILINLWR